MTRGDVVHSYTKLQIISVHVGKYRKLVVLGKQNKKRTTETEKKNWLGPNPSNKQKRYRIVPHKKETAAE